MDVAQSANVEVTHGHAREGHKGRVGPVVVLDHPPHHMEAVDRVLRGQKLVQDEKLSNNVDHV